MGAYDKMLSNGEPDSDIKKRKGTLATNSLYISNYEDPIKITDDAKNIAIMIFDQYLKRGAINYIPLPKESRDAIYEKFGIERESIVSVDESTQSDFSVKDAEDIINYETL